MSEKLTKAQVIRAANNSKNLAVKQAYEKLEFALSLAHTSEEIDDMGDERAYHIRISKKTEDGSSYEELVIRWCEDQFSIYVPSITDTYSGEAATRQEPPSTVYIRNSRNRKTPSYELANASYDAANDFITRTRTI